MNIDEGTDLPAVREGERLVVRDGGEERVTHEVEVVLVGEHVGRQVAALRERLHRVHVRHLRTYRLLT